MSRTAESLIRDMIRDLDAGEDVKDYDVFLPPGSSMVFDEGEEEEEL